MKDLEITIENLEVDEEAKLNQDTKKALVELLENEFHSEHTLFHEIQKEGKEVKVDES